MAFTRARAAAEAPTLLDALARAPAAAGLVVAALERAEDRKALRLAHPQLRDMVGEATTKLQAVIHAARAARPPTPRRWPRLAELKILYPDWATLEALGAEIWGVLRTLRLGAPSLLCNLDAPSARALAAALRRMPALRALELRGVRLPDEAAQELFRASSVEGAPQLRELGIVDAHLTPAAARMLALVGWSLEALDLRYNRDLGDAGAAALLAAPSFALRRLSLGSCDLNTASLVNIANAPRWPLEELDLSCNDFSAAAAGPALAALSRRVGLRHVNVDNCSLRAASFKALLEAAWPALTSLRASYASVAFDGAHALGAAAFAGFPALEELVLIGVELREAGTALLASRRWARLKTLNLCVARLDDAGLTVLARGAWPALERLELRHNRISALPTLEDVRRWAPALEKLVLF